MSVEQEPERHVGTGRWDGRSNLPYVENHEVSTGSSQPILVPNDSRRLRACLSCRDSKLRCKRNEESPEDGCERCVGTGRQCIVPAPVRKRRPRRNISTVASLESKVDALLVALKQKQAGEIEDNEGQSSLDFLPESHAQHLSRSPLEAGRHDDNDADQIASSEPSAMPDLIAQRKKQHSEHQYSFSFFLPRPPEPDSNFKADVIDQGLISLEQAEECFVRFTEVMLPHFPVVVFPPRIAASTVRRARPALFLAILGAASGILGEAVRKALVGEVMRTFANQIIISGDKNLDLVQAIQVSAIWYFPPERFDEVKVYQLIHMAAIMTIELDFVQAARPSTSRLSLLKDGELDRPSTATSAPKKPQAECQRALLTCYILCGIAFMITRRPNLMRWSSYMEECIRALENSGSVEKSDLFLCQWVRAQHIVEEVGRQFFMDDPSANIDVSDSNVQFVLRTFEQQFDQWKAQIPPDIIKPTLQCEASIVNLYLHEIFLHDGHNINDFRPPWTEDTQMPAPRAKSQHFYATYRRALAICIVSVRSILDIFLSFDTDTLCSIPIFHFVRTAYAVFAMMKIHFAASRIDSDLYYVMDNGDLNVEFYLDQLLKSLQEVAQTRKLRVAAIFRLVLLMLRTWFQRQKSHDNPDHGSVRTDSTILRTVLETAGSINVDGDYSLPTSNAQGGCSTADAAMVDFGIPMQSATNSSVLPAVDGWPSDLEAEMTSWDDFDFATFLENDDPSLLKIALERLGGLIG